MRAIGLTCLICACGTSAVTPNDAWDSSTEVDGTAFMVEVYSHTFENGMKDIGKGVFSEFAVEYEPIPVEPRFRHVLSFQMAPMLPPSRLAVDGQGPLILYSDELETIVFSPLDHPFASLISLREGVIHYGIHGEITEIEPGFTHRFVLMRGQGINSTIEAWGKKMLEDRGRQPVDRYADIGLSFIGYWTDNGCRYYYDLEPGMNAAETLLAVKEDLTGKGIQVGYFQLDSWWYFKESGSGLLAKGLVEWKPLPELFPDGLKAFQKALGLPLIAHNRWFAKSNAYRDRYDFVESATMAFPTSGEVFQEFMDDASSWGVVTYEQDWLQNQWNGVPWLRQRAERAEQWMSWMSDAAMVHNMTMQICMPGPAHLLDAVDRHAVTTVRTSVDHMTEYAKEAFWPAFHIVNMIAASLGLLPFKDNFHTTEFRSQEEALISALSAGMVGIGDALGSADPLLIFRTCMKNGLLLKPDRPATPIDAMFLEHKRPYTVFTWSDRKGLGKWTYLAAFRLALEDPLRSDEDRLWSVLLYEGKPLQEMYYLPDVITDWDVDLARDLGVMGPIVAYDWMTGIAEVVEGTLHLPPIVGYADHDYFVLVPILSNGLALIGETEKFVTLADKRFISIEPRIDGIDVVLAGVPGEEVMLKTYDVFERKMLPPVTATIGSGGMVEISISR